MPILFALGAVSVVAQVVFQREMVSGFYGNELFIGIVLASWFLWTAVGGLILGKFLKDELKVAMLAALVFFLEIFIIRYLKTFAGFPGEIPNLIYGVAVAFFAPAPLCLLLGAWWTTTTKKRPELVADGYLVETVGFIFGGLVFSFMLVGVNEFYIVAIVIIFIAAILFPGHRIAAVIIIIITAAALSTPYLDRINKLTTGYRYRGQELIETKNTPYGNIAVTALGGQYNFFEDSVPIGSTAKTQSVEDVAHFPLLQHPSPRNVLMIGGGLSGVAAEILKHPIEKLFYLELDPYLTELAKRYTKLSDPRLDIITDDGRHFIKDTNERFDVVIVNLPPPSTALMNRFYTKEFFETVFSKLNDGGIFAETLPYSPSAPSRTAEAVNASLYKTLKNVFTSVIVLPEDTNFFMAAKGRELSYDAAPVAERFRARDIKADLFIEPYIKYRYTTDRIQNALELFSNDKEARVNRDLFPVSYYYQNLFWLDHFYPAFTRAFAAAANYAWFGLAGVLVLAAVIFRRRPELFSMGTAGFSMMTFEMIVIFAYQIFVGYLYYRIALLISMLMLGMAAGVVIGKRVHRLYDLHIAAIVYSIIFGFMLIHQTSAYFLFGAAIVAGVLGGAVFPVANKLYGSSDTGAVYGVDLLGSCLGAVVPSVVLIPAFGVTKTIALVAFANGVAFFILLRKVKR